MFLPIKKENDSVGYLKDAKVTTGGDFTVLIIILGLERVNWFQAVKLSLI